MIIPARILQQAMELYLSLAYPDGTVPPSALARVKAVRALQPNEPVPLSLLETDLANSLPSYSLRLGQPMYPHMKLVVEPAPVAGGGGGAAGEAGDRAGNRSGVAGSGGRGVGEGGGKGGGEGGEADYLLRVDAHDRHLHASPGSPDAAWLASVRKSNKDLNERIETAWSAAGLPTFKDFLRQQLQARKAAGN